MNIVKGFDIKEIAIIDDASILLLMVAPYFSYLLFGALFLMFSLYISVMNKSYATIKGEKY